jgi:type IX secretion system PorP/SprF family membrane protein
MIRVYIFIILFFFSNGLIMSQDINFSQFYELPLLRNPSLAGIYKGDMRITSAYRNQWQSVSAPYQTSALGFELRSSFSQQSSDYFSMGVQLTNDVAGDSKLGKTQVLPLFTFHKLIYGPSNAYLSLGFMGGAVQQKFNPTTLRFDDQFQNGAYSPLNATSQTFSRTSLTYWDAAVGLNISSEFGFAKGYLGAAYFHFTQPRVAFDQLSEIRLNRKTVINAGINLPASDYDEMFIYGDLFFQGGNRQVQGGAMFLHHFQTIGEEEDLGMGIGGFYRWNDAFIPVVKFNWYKLSMGVTYDINISKLKPASIYRGGLEVSLSYKTYLNIMNTSLQKVRCVIPF